MIKRFSGSAGILLRIILLMLFVSGGRAECGVAHEAPLAEGHAEMPGCDHPESGSPAGQHPSQVPASECSILSSCGAIFSCQAAFVRSNTASTSRQPATDLTDRFLSQTLLPEVPPPRV